MQKLYDLFAFNTGKSPFHEDIAALPTEPPTKNSVRLIAYYLPQFHAIPENDAFWGTGFTEWTNVTKALPRYAGQYQPRLPADLGFYDLSHADVLRRQAELSRRAGIYGFCIHNYWFSGQRVLDTPLRTLLSNRDIDLRFCLNWANESWSRRWDSSETDILLEQRHDAGDDIRYAESILPAVMDPRYIRIHGRPLIMIYRPGVIPDARKLVENWRSFFTGKGVGDPYIVMPQAFGDTDPRVFGMDAVAGFPPHNGGFELPNERNSIYLLDRRFHGTVASFEALATAHRTNRPNEFRLFPGVCPGWDNEARKIGRGHSFYGANPEAYGRWLRSAAEQALKAPLADERIVFINAWNEWAEGAYLEPDRHFGFAYLAETRRAIDSLTTGALVVRTAVQSTATSPMMHTRLSKRHWLRNVPPRALRKAMRTISQL
jgi:lipopolysaccharide biosynthesis protein